MALLFYGRCTRSVLSSPKRRVSARAVDDNWQTMAGGESPSPLGGPTEIGNPLYNLSTAPATLYDGVISDLGFDAAQVRAQTAGWVQTMQEVQAAVIKAGGWSWAWFLPAKTPPKGEAGCAAYFRSAETKAFAKAAIQMSMAHTQTTDPADHRSTYRYTSPVEDIASFLLVRGQFAWLGAGWAGCDCYPPFIAEFQRDYGTPLDASYTEVGQGVFARRWSKADVRFNCSAYKGTIAMKTDVRLSRPEQSCRPDLNG